MSYGMTPVPVFDAVQQFCAICGQGKSWVTKEEDEKIKQNDILFICEVCEAIFGTPKLEPAGVTEIEHETEI